MSYCRTELEEAVFGPEGMDEALRPIEWVEDLVRWAEEAIAQHPDEVEDPDALWMCIGEVRAMLTKLRALAGCAQEIAPPGAGEEGER